MKKPYKSFISGLVLVLLTTLQAVADSSEEKEVALAERQAITIAFHKVRPDIKILSITPTLIEGVSQVKLDQGILYTLQGGKFFIAGDLYQMAESGMVNITENGRTEERKGLLENIKDEDKIIFAAKNEKAVVHVFTDVDCAYCRKLHSEIKEYNKLGITIKYLAFPREGIGSTTYRKMVTTWCADDRKHLLTEFKNGATLPFVSCENDVVKEQYQLGLKMGVNGTPAMILSTGKMLAGYLPPAQLAQTLGLKP